MDLTKIELQFLKEKGFCKHDVYDAVGMKQAHWMLQIKKEDKPIAIGNPCNHGKHRLKWPSGHCAQCNPNHIGKGFSDRFSATKHIYIAGSLSRHLIKIGVGDNPIKRVSKLQYDRYAGTGDWHLLFHVKVPNAGRVEHDALTSLKKYSTKPTYRKDGFEQEAIEALECSFLAALTAIVESMTVRHSEYWKSPKIAQYEFK